MSHGGARPGAGASPKPPLTRSELARAVDRAAELNSGRVSLRGLVDAINEERTRGYVDPRSIRRLKVSTWWVREQRKMLRESSHVQKPELESHTWPTAPRMSPTGFWGKALLDGHIHHGDPCRCGASENRQAEVNGQEPKAPAEPAVKVESEQSGAT